MTAQVTPTHPEVGDMGAYRALAAAVLQLAVDDARGVGAYVSTSHRAMARAWLLHSDTMVFWAAVAGVNAERIRRAVDRPRR